MLTDVVRDAPSEELVRGFLACVLVVVLLALIVIPPDGKDDLVASSKTLAIAVIAFYFGLHKATHVDREPPTSSGEREQAGPEPNT